MSGEAFLPADGRPATDADHVASLRAIVDDLRLMLADEQVNRTAVRFAANELDALANALEAGGGVAHGYAAVPLLDAAVGPAPVPPPSLPPPGGGGIAAEAGQ